MRDTALSRLVEQIECIQISSGIILLCLLLLDSIVWCIERMNASVEKYRLDKWLWAARFFKTRAQAAAAIDAGKVQVNGMRAKPARVLVVTDKLIIRLSPYQYEVEVLALSARRGPASEAQKHYRESNESKAKREALAFELKAQAVSNYPVKGRPTKKDRREIERFKSDVW